MLLPISVPNLLWAYWKLYSRIGEQNKSLSMQNLKWQLYVYRCISTYARTSNCQIHSRGLLLHSKTLYWYFTDAKYFLELFLWNYFSMHIKAEGMTQFDIFHVFVENSVNELYSNQQKSEIYPKMPMLSSLENNFQWIQKRFLTPH